MANERIRPRDFETLTVIPLVIVFSLFEPSDQSNLESKQPLILIVGPPLAGTTLVYQVLLVSSTCRTPAI